MNEYNIAVILTCFNRKDKTVSCLNGLYSSQKACQKANIAITVYLTDDGCTDGTSQAVRDAFPNKNINILQGTGNLYWAGGMRLAWGEALNNRDSWDFYLLLNDDTTPQVNMFEELLNAHEYSLKTYDKPGVYSGVTCDVADPDVITYGGSVWVNRIIGTDKMVLPNGTPQMVDKTNANILMVAKEVTDKMGIFYEGYIHGAADYDYSLQAKKHGFTALITANTCGKCVRDHRNWKAEKKKIMQMSLAERRKYYSNPIHSSKDKLMYTRRNTPLRYPLVWVGRFLNETCPKLYYLTDIIRGL